MKKFLRMVVSGTLVLTFSLLFGNGCKKSPDELKGSTVSAEKTSFKQVTSRLDAGGNFYLYLGTEQLLNGLSGKISGWRQVFASMPDADGNAENIAKAFDVVTNVIGQSGLEDVSGFGMSAIATEPGFYRTKAFLHHYSGKGGGFLWKLGGEKPHALTGLDLLPANTAFATFTDLDVPLMWSVIEKQVEQSGFAEAQEFLRQMPDEFEKATGMKWSKTLESLGGEFGVVVTLDETKMIPVPLPTSEALQIPEPGLMLVMKVKDDVIFNRIDKALKDSGMPVAKADKANLKMRTVAVPLPLPIELRPTVAASEGYLIIATTDALIQQALAVKSGQKPGLKTTDEFKRLAKDIPQQGNQFTFLSQRFGKTIFEIQKQALEMAAKSKGAEAQWIQSLLKSDKAAICYSVSANTDEGWYSVGNGNQHPAKMIAAAAVVPVAMLSAIAIPNFVKARSTAQRNACINNLRQIDAAKQQWALEKNKTSDAVPTADDLKVYLRNEQLPVCPQGGDYTIGPVGEQPKCSVPGHMLP